MEDPLVAMATAIAAQNPLTPPDEQMNQVEANESAKLPDTPIEQELDEDPFETALAEPEPDAEKAHLITHAKVYAIAEK